MSETSINGAPEPPDPKFLIDSDCDPELVNLLRRIHFQARSVLKIKIKGRHRNDDTQNLIWAREHGYMLVCHDQISDAQTRHSFNSELYYRGGQVLRIGGQPGQDPRWALAKILVWRPRWEAFFREDSGMFLCGGENHRKWTAAELFAMTSYELRLPFDDPAVPLKRRLRLEKRARKSSARPGEQRLPLRYTEGDDSTASEAC